LLPPVPTSLAVADSLAVSGSLAVPESLAGPVLAVPELLAVPVSEGAFEPQPALIRPITAARARATNGRGLLLMFAPYVRLR
jgi:hypothetical protein